MALWSGVQGATIRSVTVAFRCLLSLVFSASSASMLSWRHD
jgi:hypothetical protein